MFYRLKDVITLILGSILSFLRLFISQAGTTDHKKIGVYYIVFGGLSAVIGTLLSVLIRMQLSTPNGAIFGSNYQLYNTVITLHGLIMIFMYVMPVLIGGFGNYFVPILIGAPEMAFERILVYISCDIKAPKVFVIYKTLISRGGVNIANSLRTETSLKRLYIRHC